MVNSAAAASSTRFRPKRSLVNAATLAPRTHPIRRLLAAISVCASLNPNCCLMKTMAPLMTAVSKPNNKPPIATTTAGRYRCRAEPFSTSILRAVFVVGDIVDTFNRASFDFAQPAWFVSSSNRQPPLLQEYQSAGPSHPAESDDLLKYNRNLPPQQYLCPAGKLALDRGNQRGAGSRDISSQNENFRIEGVQETHHRRAQILQSSIDNVAGAWVAVVGSTKDGLRTGRLATLAHREFGRGRAMYMCQVV